LNVEGKARCGNRCHRPARCAGRGNASRDRQARPCVERADHKIVTAAAPPPSLRECALALQASAPTTPPRSRMPAAQVFATFAAANRSAMAPVRQCDTEGQASGQQGKN